MHDPSYFLRSSLRRAFPKASILFVPAASPGLVFRILEKEAARPAFRRTTAPDLAEGPTQTLISELSGPPVLAGLRPWRVLRFSSDSAEGTANIAAYTKRIAPLLSSRLNERVFLLHTAQGVAVWTFWDNGEEAQSPPPTPAPPFWSRLLGFPRGNRDTEAFARQHGLPLRGLLAQAKHKRRTVDYDSIAGLERKGLFVENEPVWYRFAGETGNDIIKP